jgi:peptidoglycan/LPS O-acetylase OafA/YrhL
LGRRASGFSAPTLLGTHRVRESACAIQRVVRLLAETREVESSRGFGYKPGLDGLRAVAVVSVMAYHFGATWAPGGFLGVDLFFVLSGYLITSLLVIEWDGTSTIAFGAFWARRARRLLPALVLVLVAIAIWSALDASRDQLSTIRWDSIWTLFYGANWRFIATGQSYFDLFRDPSPLRHAWSLAIEEQFYLVWPIVAFCCLRLARGRRWVLAGACIAGIVASTLLMARWYDAADPSRSYYGTDARAGQLLLGALLALVLVRWSPRTAAERNGIQAAGVAGAVFCVWAFASTSDHQSWLYHGGFLVFAVAVAAVIAAVVQPRRSALHSLLTLRPVIWVGAISYGLYLWHWPVAVALTEGHSGLSGVRLAIARVGVTLAAATLSYYFLELPIRRGRWLRGPATRAVVPVVGIATAAVIVVATSGATPPPRFLVATPDSVVKTRPAAAPVAPLQQSEAQLGVTRMLLLGDSVADTLGNELRATAATHGVAFEAYTRPGCGMTTVVPLLDSGAEVPWGEACASDTAKYQRDAIEGVAPDVVLWLSTWETSDGIAGDATVRFGSRAADDALLAELEAGRDRLVAGGARLVLVTVPPPAETSEVHPLRADEAIRRRHLGVLFRRFAARHPADVGVADLSAIVCPRGDPCAASVDGVVLRPYDGNHFEGGGPAWVAPRLYAAVLQALSAMLPSFGATPDAYAP